VLASRFIKGSDAGRLRTAILAQGPFAGVRSTQMATTEWLARENGISCKWI